jgi:hypothetical protein
MRMRRGTSTALRGQHRFNISFTFSRLLPLTLASHLPLDSWQWTNGGRKQMAEDRVEQDIVGAEETVGEVRLWQAVVVRAIEDWMSGPLRQRRHADHYIFGKHADFDAVCQSAGLDADDLRARLSRIRSRHLHEQHAIAA